MLSAYFVEEFDQPPLNFLQTQVSRLGGEDWSKLTKST